METQFFRFVEAKLPNGDPVRISVYKKFRDGTLTGIRGETDEGKEVYHGSAGYYIRGSGRLQSPSPSAMTIRGTWPYRVSPVRDVGSSDPPFISPLNFIAELRQYSGIYGVI